jgi:hypothetical protein
MTGIHLLKHGERLVPTMLSTMESFTYHDINNDVVVSARCFHCHKTLKFPKAAGTPPGEAMKKCDCGVWVFVYLPCIARLYV